MRNKKLFYLIAIALLLTPLLVACDPPWVKRIGADEVCWIVRSDVDPANTPIDKQITVYTRGTDKGKITNNQYLKCGAYATIASNEIAYYGDKILPPGTYLNIPND